MNLLTKGLSLKLKLTSLLAKEIKMSNIINVIKSTLNANTETFNAIKAKDTESITMGELVGTHNALAKYFGEKPVKKFATEIKGFERVGNLYDSAISRIDAANVKKPTETPKPENKDKVEKTPKAPNFTPAYSWRRQKSLLSLLKELTIENVTFGMGVVGKNGDNDCLRDKVSAKLKGTKTPLARIAVKLGENGLREIYVPENVNTLVLSNDDKLAVTEIKAYIEARLAKLKEDEVALIKVKEDAKQKKADDKLKAKESLGKDKSTKDKIEASE